LIQIRSRETLIYGLENPQDLKKYLLMVKIYSEIDGFTSRIVVCRGGKSSNPRSSSGIKKNSAWVNMAESHLQPGQMGTGAAVLY
jgi:hypothetical protein